MTPPTNAELVAMLREHDAKLDRELYGITGDNGAQYITTRDGFPRDVWITVEGIGKVEKAGSIIALRNHAALVADRLEAAEARIAEYADALHDSRTETTQLRARLEHALFQLEVNSPTVQSGHQCER